MPQISTFYGIIILMNYADYTPPHFHAWYNEYKILVNIQDGIVKGEMPARALRMVLDWRDEHKEELMRAWNEAQSGAIIGRIDPLK